MKKVKYFSESNRRILLGVGIIVAIIIAVLAYALEKEKEPVRIAFSTKGGGVIFNHQNHTSLENIKCEDCHHNYDPTGKDSGSMNCRKCHYSKEFEEICQDESVHKRCIGKNCLECHEPGSVDCNFCHNAENFKKAVEPQKVEFNTDGGVVIFDHFQHASPDEFGVECDSCHHGYQPEKKNTFPMNCRRCHYNKKYESVCETDDIHTRCIGKNCIDCHDDGVDDCAICHQE